MRRQHHGAGALQRQRRRRRGVPAKRPRDGDVPQPHGAHQPRALRALDRAADAAGRRRRVPADAVLLAAVVPRRRRHALQLRAAVHGVGRGAVGDVRQRRRLVPARLHVQLGRAHVRADRAAAAGAAAAAEPAAAKPAAAAGEEEEREGRRAVVNVRHFDKTHSLTKPKLLSLSDTHKQPQRKNTEPTAAVTTAEPATGELRP